MSYSFSALELLNKTDVILISGAAPLCYLLLWLCENKKSTVKAKLQSKSVTEIIKTSLSPL